jgi:hypothetical protein
MVGSSTYLGRREFLYPPRPRTGDHKAPFSGFEMSRGLRMSETALGELRAAAREESVDAQVR